MATLDPILPSTQHNPSELVREAVRTSARTEKTGPVEASYPALTTRSARPDPARSLFSFYVRALRAVFHEEQRASRVIAGRGPTVFFVASALHAFGHAGLALAAGRCAVILAGCVGVDDRMGGAAGLSLRSLAATGSTSADASTRALRTALVLGSIGLTAALAKAGGGVIAAHGQARVAGRVAGLLRLEVLDAWFARYRLRRPRQPDHGQWTPPPHQGPLPHLRLRPGRPDLIPLRAAARGVSALTARVAEVEMGLSCGLLGGGRAVAQLVPLAVALMWIAPRLALAAFGVLGPFSFLLSFSRRSFQSAHASAAREGEELLEAADEAVRNADLWVSYSAEPKARAAVSRLGETLGARSARLQASSAAMSGANEVLAALALVGALGAAQAGWLGSVGDTGRLLAFTVCFFLAYRPLRDLTEARLAWARAAMAYADLTATREAVDFTPATSPSDPLSTAPPSPWPLATLHVDGLVLRHGTRSPISFSLQPGEVLVVAGATGEGKTTLLRTLLGLSPVLAGAVRYGADDLTCAAPGLAARPFAWVPQDSPLLADTLEANVRLGLQAGISFDVPAALASLGGSALLAGTAGRPLGPGGVVVSGGERQWVALARALATRQPVLLLDEPTSGLDADSQREVLDAVARLRGTRSVVFVTHRPEPLALAHTVVRFNQGKVTVEAGRLSPRAAPG